MQTTTNHDDHKVVFGIYETRATVEHGVERLKNEGFSNDDISVLLPETGGSENFAHEKSSKAPEGASAGAGTGLLLGGILGWLVGIGALAIPGVGPFIAAGPLMALMAGAGTGAAVGGIAGGLIGLGIPEYEAKRYENFVKDGGILLSVHIADDDKLSHAEQILEDTGAKDISSTTEVPEARMTHTTVVGVQPTTF